MKAELRGTERFHSELLEHSNGPNSSCIMIMSGDNDRALVLHAWPAFQSTRIESVNGQRYSIYDRDECKRKNLIVGFSRTFVPIRSTVALGRRLQKIIR